MITRRGELAVLDRAGALTGPADADRFVSEQTQQRIIDAVPANTVRAYTRQWATFTAWCAAEQCLKPVDVDVREGRTFPVIE
jgi:hypothetical protein